MKQRIKNSSKEGLETIIIIPTYNERGNIKVLIPKIFQILPRAAILIVDDSSPDGTAEEVRWLQGAYRNLFLLVRPSKKGLGSAYKEAFQKILKGWPSAQVVVMMDADLYHDPLFIPNLIKGIRNYDLVIGFTRPRQAHRVLLSKWANLYCRIILGSSLMNWTSGFLAIRVSSLKKIDVASLHAREFAFLTDLRHALLRAGATCKEITVSGKARTYGRSKINVSTILEAAITPWRLRFKRR